MSENDRPTVETYRNSTRGRGHGPIEEASIEVYDDVLTAEQCQRCKLKVPIEGDGFETYSCDRVNRLSAPKFITKEERTNGE